jgi:hypothetical protein
MYDRGRIMSEEERLQIMDWACAIFFTMKYLGNRRLEYTLSPLDSSIPTVIWKIKQRLVSAEKLRGFVQEPIVKDILYIILPKGFIHRHKDPNMGEYIHSRFNIFVNVPKEGAKTYYGSQLVDARAGHYTMCKSGLENHWSDPIGGTEPRVSLSFGFFIPRETVIKMYRQPLEKEEGGAPRALEVGLYYAYRMFWELGFKSFYTQHPALELRQILNML